MKFDYFINKLIFLGDDLKTWRQEPSSENANVRKSKIFDEIPSVDHELKTQPSAPKHEFGLGTYVFHEFQEIPTYKQKPSPKRNLPLPIPSTPKHGFGLGMYFIVS